VFFHERNNTLCCIDGVFSSRVETGNVHKACGGDDKSDVLSYQRNAMMSNLDCRVELMSITVINGVFLCVSVMCGAL